MADLPTKDVTRRDLLVFSLGGVTVVETEYFYRAIDWHRHEMPYFSFVLDGLCRESNRRKTYDCNTNSLLFHNAGDSHYNIKSERVSRSVAVELDLVWCRKYEVDLDSLPSSIQVVHPDATLIFYNLYKEAKMSGPTSAAAVDALLLDGFATVSGYKHSESTARPRWVDKLEEVLREDVDQLLSLTDISGMVGVHPVHLSREFARYFRCNFSEYSRKMRLEKALGLLRKPFLSLADVSAECGFSDQSHFIRCFRKCLGITPLAFRRTVL
jgi:AraC family transcriptional regulator